MVGHSRPTSPTGRHSSHPAIGWCSPVSYATSGTTRTNVDRTSFEFPQGYSIYMEGAQGDAVGYWRFPTHPGTQPGVVKKSHRLRDLIGTYIGPDLIVDFNETNTIIGIELVE